MASISPDIAQLDPLFDSFVTKLMEAAAADVALNTAVDNLVAARDDRRTKLLAVFEAHYTFQRRVIMSSLNGPQRQAFRRVFGDTDGDLKSIVHRALEL